MVTHAHPQHARTCVIEWIRDLFLVRIWIQFMCLCSRCKYRAVLRGDEAWRIAGESFCWTYTKVFVRPSLSSWTQQRAWLPSSGETAHCSTPLSSMLGVENCSSYFDSPPKAWMSESGLSEPQMTAHHTQWKNWHVSDRAQESGEYRGVNAFLLLILIVWKPVPRATRQRFIKPTFQRSPSLLNSARLPELLFSEFMNRKDHRGQNWNGRIWFSKTLGAWLLTWSVPSH